MPRVLASDISGHFDALLRGFADGYQQALRLFSKLIRYRGNE